MERATRSHRKTLSPARGKGNAVRRAFLDIDADIYVLADADLTYPASQVHELMEPVFIGDADMVVGDRHSTGHYAAENTRAANLQRQPLKQLVEPTQIGNHRLNVSRVH